MMGDANKELANSGLTDVYFCDQCDDLAVKRFDFAGDVICPQDGHGRMTVGSPELVMPKMIKKLLDAQAMLSSDDESSRLIRQEDWRIIGDALLMLSMVNRDGGKDDPHFPESTRKANDRRADMADEAFARVKRASVTTGDTIVWPDPMVEAEKVRAVGRLQRFLYILVRDFVVSGNVEKIFRDNMPNARIPATASAKFSCPHNEALAKQWAERILQTGHGWELALEEMEARDGDQHE